MITARPMASLPIATAPNAAAPRARAPRARAAPATFTLGQLFAIWGQPLESTNVAGLTGMPVIIYVTDNNGVVSEATGNWRDIELLSHREITIQVGTPVTEIPNFTWSGN